MCLKAYGLFVPYQELHFKLWKIGINGPLWRMFQGYLTDPHHFVMVLLQNHYLFPRVSRKVLGIP